MAVSARAAVMVTLAAAVPCCRIGPDRIVLEAKGPHASMLDRSRECGQSSLCRATRRDFSCCQCRTSVASLSRPTFVRDSISDVISDASHL